MWVGYSPGPGVTNYWSIGAAKGPAIQPGSPGGKPRPGPNTSSQNGTNGLWTFDHPVHGDSLQGWWPVRELDTNVSGATRRGHQPRVVGDRGRQPGELRDQRRARRLGIHVRHEAGDRTFGVVGVWHSDPGNTSKIVDPSDPKRIRSLRRGHRSPAAETRPGWDSAVTATLRWWIRSRTTRSTMTVCSTTGSTAATRRATAPRSTSRAMAVRWTR